MKPITGGVWPAMFSPLNEDRTPNLEMTDRLVELLVSQNLDGLYVLGSTGQGPALRLEDRRALAVRITRQAISPRFATRMLVNRVIVFSTVYSLAHLFMSPLIFEPT